MTQLNANNLPMGGIAAAAAPADQSSRDLLLKSLEQATDKLGLYRPNTPVNLLPDSLVIKEGDRTQALRRGRYIRPAEEQVGRINLVEVDGVLSWQDANEVGVPISPTAPAGDSGGLRRGWFSRPRGEIVQQYKFEKLPPNQVGGFLKSLDEKLTPDQGLKEWKDGKLNDDAKPAMGDKILLIIHGTFSNASTILQQLDNPNFKEGNDFLKWAADQTRYNKILAFDHPTLSVSPLLNALELQRKFDVLGSAKSVDVICHSRGGLVARWWIEAFGGGRCVRKVVFVGSPLAGTSLAAPPALRSAMDLLTNVGKIIGGLAGAASVAVPFMAVAAGLMKVITSITGTIAHTPLLDAAVAMIPGFACQSRVGNNFELIKLREGNSSSLPDYHAITAAFHPDEVGWKVWRIFSNFKERVAELGAGLVFQSANDLVVNTDSMRDLFGAPVIGDTDRDSSFLISDANKILDFGDTPKVFHTNYFQQPLTATTIQKWLNQ